MSHNGRLSAEERRQAIADAVRGVFADKGFDGTTTRELAKAAGVSEALLYKHFPSKESLYAAMLDACVKGPTFAEFKRILTLDPSTSTLVFMVHFVVTRFVQGWAGDPNQKVMDRLSVRSLLDDGAFVGAGWNRRVRTFHEVLIEAAVISQHAQRRSKAARELIDFSDTLPEIDFSPPFPVTSTIELPGAGT